MDGWVYFSEWQLLLVQPARIAQAPDRHLDIIKFARSAADVHRLRRWTPIIRTKTFVTDWVGTTEQHLNIVHGLNLKFQDWNAGFNLFLGAGVRNTDFHITALVAWRIAKHNVRLQPCIAVSPFQLYLTEEFRQIVACRYAFLALRFLVSEQLQTNAVAVNGSLELQLNRCGLIQRLFVAVKESFFGAPVKVAL